jgi:NAD(P)-dependent dehydrogenase (short-subunit alcohol dehydrogenase family)
MWYPSSNRDETRYEDADRFDVTRNPEHQAFGAGGRHFCLRTALARSSGLGSLAQTTNTESPASQWIVPAYCSSKAALNMLTTQYAKAFPAMRINAVDPGYTATDLNFNSGTQTVSEGTGAIVTMATIGPNGPTGTVVSRNGPVAWLPRRPDGYVHPVLGELVSR